MTVPGITEDNDSFLRRMENLDDKELLDVIKNGSAYQPQAVEAAVTVAVKRKLIAKEEGEALLGYTIEAIRHSWEEQAKEVRIGRAKGRFEMVLGIVTFTAGLAFTINSSQHIWIGALIVGPVLFIRGLFR